MYGNSVVSGQEYECFVEIAVLGSKNATTSDYRILKGAFSNNWQPARSFDFPAAVLR